MDDMQRTRGPRPKSTKLAPTTVSVDEKAEIERRAAAAGMTTADYVRRRALGEACSPAVKRATVQG